MFDHRIRAYALLTLALVAAAVAPSPLLAQRSAETDLGVVDSAAAPAATLAPMGARAPSFIWVLAGPQVASARWAPTLSADVIAQDRVRAGSNVAMMGVGAAGLAVGLLVGGDSGMIIATTSGVVGLIGLYRYLR